MVQTSPSNALVTAGVVLTACLLAPPVPAQDLRDETYLRRAGEGFRAIYNLDYDEAFRVFSELRSDKPAHPGPPLDASCGLRQRIFARRRHESDCQQDQKEQDRCSHDSWLLCKTVFV